VSFSHRKKGAHTADGPKARALARNRWSSSAAVAVRDPLPASVDLTPTFTQRRRQTMQLSFLESADQIGQLAIVQVRYRPE
jgi:hypothetical protein